MPTVTTMAPVVRSNKTKALENLMESEVTSQTVTKVKAVLEEPEETTAEDVVHALDIFHRASELQNISEQTAKEMLKTLDILSELDQPVLQQSNSKANITNSLILTMEQLADRVNLKGGGGEMHLKTNSTVLQVWNLTSLSLSSSSQSSESLPLGLQMTVEGGSLNVSPVHNGSGSASEPNFEAAIFMPRDIGRQIVQSFRGSDIRLSLSVLTQTTMFQVDRPTDPANSVASQARDTERESSNRTSGRLTLGSRVISMRISVDGRPVINLSKYGSGQVTMVLKLMKRHQWKEGSGDEDPVQCVFWAVALRDGRGGWSTEGCQLGKLTFDTAVCLCNHLTYYGVLMGQIEDGVKRVTLDQSILTILTTVGMAFSICGLSLTLLAFLLVRKLRKNPSQQVLFNLALALLLTWLIFLLGIERRESEEACLAAAIVLHYTILASLMWMVAQGLLLYLKLVKLRQHPVSRYALKAGLLAWGLPIIPVIIVSSIDVKLYVGEGNKHCWMSAPVIYYAMWIPVGMSMIINLFIYVMLVFRICCRRNVRPESGNHVSINIRASFSCFVVLGLSWLFAFMMVGEAARVFQYLFTITTAPQGFLIFLLFTARDPDVRAFCLKKLHRGDHAFDHPRAEQQLVDGTRVSNKTSTKETNL